MDPQLSKTHLKTLRYKTEIFKLVTKHESLAERKKQTKKKQLWRWVPVWRDFLLMQITSLDTSRLEARKLADIIFSYKSTLNYFNYKAARRRRF